MTEDEILEQYGRPLAHMRRQLRDKRFGLIFGSGASNEIGFPRWEKLVESVARDADVKSYSVATEMRPAPLPIVSEALFQRFKERNRRRAKGEARDDADVERLLRAWWLEVVKRCLYAGIPENIDHLLAADKVYQHFLHAIKESPMTVNYNYDDSIQRLLLHTREPKERERRGFETVTDPRLQFGLNTGIIYHPNGHLPRNPLEASSEKIVFNEGSFADQLIDTMGGVYTALLHHLMKNTCLLIGLSLRDETLRHLLRQAAILSPGNYHYYVSFRKALPAKRTPAMEGEAAANFETYNLITLFLDTEGQAALGGLLGADEEGYREKADDADVPFFYTYFITGVPGVGKTTIINYFKNLAAYGEWPDERLPEMGRVWKTLTDAEKIKVDTWVRQQVVKKNKRLDNDKRKTGGTVAIVDRCWPDAITFTEASGWAAKAKSLLKELSPKAKKRDFHGGHVVLLLGDAAEIKVRATMKGKGSDPEVTRQMQEALKVVYPEGAGVTHLDVRSMTVIDVVKSLARIIHMEDYASWDPHDALTQIAAGAVVAPP